MAVSAQVLNDLPKNTEEIMEERFAIESSHFWN